MLISPYANFQTDFNNLGRGSTLFNRDKVYGLLSSLIILSLAMPFLLAKFKPKTPSHPSADFMALLPQNKKEYIWFFFMVVAVSIGEELIFREFYFELLYDTYHIRGDILLLVSAVIFGLVHVYQGIWGILATFFLGLVFGKTFQITGSLTLPILLHFLIDIRFLWNILIEDLFFSYKRQ